MAENEIQFIEFRNYAFKKKGRQVWEIRLEDVSIVCWQAIQLEKQILWQIVLCVWQGPLSYFLMVSLEGINAPSTYMVTWQGSPFVCKYCNFTFCSSTQTSLMHEMAFYALFDDVMPTLRPKKSF